MGRVRVRHRVRVKIRVRHRVPFRPFTVCSTVLFRKISYSCKIGNETQSFSSAVIPTLAGVETLQLMCHANPAARGWYNFRNGTAEWNDCVSFRILQEYDNLLNGTAECTVIGRNGTLILTLCLTLPNPNPTLTLTK